MLTSNNERITDRDLEEDFLRERVTIREEAKEEEGYEED